MNPIEAVVTEPTLEAWGREVGRSVATPAFFALHGSLGAGKSVFARAVARGAGVRGAVPSPTYTLVQPYEPVPDRRIVHMDLYRLGDADEVVELGWDDWVDDPGTVVLVEWAERAAPYLPRDRWDLHLSPVEGDALSRRLAVVAVGRPPALPPMPEPMVEAR